VSESNDFLKTLDLSRVTTYQGAIMLSAVHRLISKEAANCLKKYNLTMMEWSAFGFIYDHKRVRTSKLSKSLNFTMPYATNLVNGLEAKGYVTRVEDDTDSRSKLLELTNAAKKDYATIEKDLRDVLREEVYRKVSPDDFTIYLKVLFELGTQAAQVL
jgi:DNA-binding MarR family transcriptional regulator